MSRIVLIAAATEGYRRGGLKFGVNPKEIDLSTLDNRQAETIMNDPNLTIKDVTSSDCSVCEEKLATAHLTIDEQAKEIDGLKQVIAEMSEDNKPDEGTHLSLIEAIGQLNVDVEDHWTKTGKPEIGMLEALTGRNVSAAERDQAWQEYQATKAQLEA